MITTPKGRNRNRFGEVRHSYKGHAIKKDYTHCEISRFAGGGAFDRRTSQRIVYYVYTDMTEKKYYPTHFDTLRDAKEYVDTLHKRRKFKEKQDAEKKAKKINKIIFNTFLEFPFLGMQRVNVESAIREILESEADVITDASTMAGEICEYLIPMKGCKSKMAEVIQDVWNQA